MQPEVDYVVIEGGAKAIERLVTLMDSKNAEALLDRGYGRPMQGVELSEQEEIRTPTLVRVTFVTPPKRDEYCSIPQRPSLIGISEEK